MDASTDYLLRAYLDARLVASHYPDDPTPVEGAWTAQRALEGMLLKRGWAAPDLDAVFARHERAYLLALDAKGWCRCLVEAFVQSTERSTRVTQALTRYRQRMGGPAD